MQACDNIFTNLLDKRQDDNNYFLNSARKQIHEIILTTNGNIDEITQNLLSAGYENNKVNYFASSIEKRKSELFYLTLLMETCKQGEIVASFDWLVKLTCGTSDLKTLKYPLMQLIFTTLANQSGEKKRLYDIDKNMLIKLIEVLENIDNNVT